MPPLSFDPLERLVVLARWEGEARLMAWQAKRPIRLPLPAQDAHGLAIDRGGRAAVVAGRDVFVADPFASQAGRWSALAAFRRRPGNELTSGLAWSPNGLLASAEAPGPALSPFTVVAGPPDGVPVRIEVGAGLDGRPAWLDADRLAVVAVRDPLSLLAVISVGGREVRLEPMELRGLAATSSGDLVAVAARYAPRVELTPLAELATDPTPIAVLEMPDALGVGPMAFSPDGEWLAVTWLTEDSAFVALHDRASGWQERNRIEATELGLDGSALTMEPAWRP